MRSTRQPVKVVPGALFPKWGSRWRCRSTG